MVKKLSVVIPTYDRQILTDRAIESIASLRPDLMEIVVVDDGGKIHYQHGKSKNIHGIDVRVIRLHQNGGPGVARKIAVEQCASSVIAFLDSDDVFEQGWVDAGLEEFVGKECNGKRKKFMAGRVKKGSVITQACFNLLLCIPDRFKLPACRLMVLIFNPFYTPSVILSRDLCRFSESLRYCEDYFTNLKSIFDAEQIVLSSKYSCVLSRAPGEYGGESGQSLQMFKGEMAVRMMALRSGSIPWLYKLVVPVGIVYQLIREVLKRVIKAALRLLRLVASPRKVNGLGPLF
jgi:glycosyltransferase involved in cell wall biosynthesis